VAGIVAATGDVAEAATLWAAAETIRREASYHLLLADRRRVDREIAAGRDRCAEDAWWAAWAAGERLDLEESIARAHAALPPTDESVGTGGSTQVAV
jgi:hypothetical protein